MMVARIIWINGPFGVGKTTLARHLAAAIGQSIILDPERLGGLLLNQIPVVLHADEMECEPVWRKTLLSMLQSAAQTYDWPIIVPMMIARPQGHDEIIGGLAQAGVSVSQFTLLAEPKNILARMQARGDGPASWEARQVARCVEELRHPRYAEHIDTTAMSIRDVVRHVLTRLSIPLPQRNLS
jgi:predicted kinase